jgi:tetratricopeptide (TPR) repeat protein
MQSCKFDRVLLLSDRVFNLDNIESLKIPSINTKEHYSTFVLKELNKYIQTDFVLMIQWDGYIVHAESWLTEFQNYDYIGAKWHWYNDGFNIGNGGFSFRSKRLLHVLSNDKVPITSESLKYGEDTFICRLYRRFLETQDGIKFAPESIADRFSHERSDPIGKPFGFHGLFNMWRYVGDEELKGFANLLNPRTLGSIEALELGYAYYKLGKFKQAEIIYNKIIKFCPENTDALKLRQMLRAVQSRT